MSDIHLIIRQLGRQNYAVVWQAMQSFTDQRTALSPDELWLVEHPPVFTLGHNGKTCHVLHAGDIPVVKTDRGGQVTYHGPGQLVAYVLADLKRLHIGVRQLVTQLETTIINLLANYGIAASSKLDAPGVYIDTAKICSLGLKIRRGCSFHGLSLNVTMDLEPFERINPCGYANLKITQLNEFKQTVSLQSTATQLAECFINQLGYSYATTALPLHPFL